MAEWSNKNPQEDMSVFFTYDDIDKVPGVDKMYVVETINSDALKTVCEIPDEGKIVWNSKNSSGVSVLDMSTPSSVEQYHKGKK